MVLRHRTKKQIIIAVVFFSFWGGVFSLIVWALHDTPPPLAPASRQARALEVVSAHVLRTVPGRADLIGILRNTNPDAGAGDVRYTFVLRSGETILRSIPGRTFILPGRQKYVIAFNEEVPPETVTAELTVEQPPWTFVRGGFTPPSIILVNQSRRVIPGTPEIFTVKGLLANESNVDYLRVEVVTIGVDAEGAILGASQSFVGSLSSRERREFTAQWPLTPGQAVAQVIVLPDINIFRADAIQERQGSLDVRDVPRPITSPPS